MNIPKQIKIGGRIYKTFFSEEALDDGYNGTSYLEKGKIMLAKGNPLEQQEITFLHEIIHIILQQVEYQQGLQFENVKKAEEQLCKTLSYKLWEVLKNNKL